MWRWGYLRTTTSTSPGRANSVWVPVAMVAAGRGKSRAGEEGAVRKEGGRGDYHLERAFMIIIRSWSRRGAAGLAATDDNNGPDSGAGSEQTRLPNVGVDRGYGEVGGRGVCVGSVQRCKPRRGGVLMRPRTAIEDRGALGVDENKWTDWGGERKTNLCSRLLPAPTSNVSC